MTFGSDRSTWKIKAAGYADDKIVIQRWDEPAVDRVHQAQGKSQPRIYFVGSVLAEMVSIRLLLMRFSRDAKTDDTPPTLV